MDYVSCSKRFRTRLLGVCGVEMKHPELPRFRDMGSQKRDSLTFGQYRMLSYVATLPRSALWSSLTYSNPLLPHEHLITPTIIKYPSFPQDRIRRYIVCLKIEALGEKAVTMRDAS